MQRAASIRRAASSAVVGLSLLLTASDGSAEKTHVMLLEAPPKELAFKLDVPQDKSSMDLMLAFRDASAERFGPVRVYTTSQWGRWIKRPWIGLAWHPSGEVETSSSPGLDATIDKIEMPRIESELFNPFSGVAELSGVAASVARDRLWASYFAPATPASFTTTGFGLTTDGFDTVFKLPPVKPVVDWRCRRKPVLLSRPGGEAWWVELVRCDGSMAQNAIDRVSLLARAPGASIPEPTDDSPRDILPEEPDPETWRSHREWAPGIRLMHPRLIWALQQLADVFPRKPFILFSGYRPYAEIHDGTSHRSLHASGRALDLAIRGVSNEELFQACTKLRGIACGFYPHNKFIHIDVRLIGFVVPNAGEAFFVDASMPGEPAKYVADYPGIVQGGKLIAPPPK